MRSARLALVLALTVALSACNLANRLSQVGSEPPLAKIENPGAGPNGIQPISLPMPAPQSVERQPNSLWRPGSRAFLRDQRASRVGDLLTVIIEIADNAQLNNTTTRSRGATENASASAFLGLESELSKFLPDAVNPADLVDLDSDSTSSGVGSVNRGETINLRVGGLVTQVLGNGNLVVAGRQEVRVNYEKRILQVAGIIRPEDLTNDNTISYDQIAEARIAYGGEGQLSDLQQPRYGQQVFDILWPF